MSEESARVKVLFRLERDSDGYPPDDVESVWGIRTREGIAIDNVPFFARGIAVGDVVAARTAPDGALEFANVLRRGGHSTYRVLVLDLDKDPLTQVMAEFVGLGLEVEEDAGLLAVDVPASVPLDHVLEYFYEGIQAGRWEVEEGFRAAHA